VPATGIIFEQASRFSDQATTIDSQRVPDGKRGPFRAKPERGGRHFLRFAESPCQVIDLNK